MGADKVLLFLKSVNEKGRMAILPELKDDEGAYGLTEDWNEVERVCRRHDEKRSVTTRPTRSGEMRAVSDYALPLEESSTHEGLEEYDLEALVWEAYEIVKAQIEAEEGFTMETRPTGSEYAEDEASLRMEDGAYLKWKTNSGRADKDAKDSFDRLD